MPGAARRHRWVRWAAALALGAMLARAPAVAQSDTAWQATWSDQDRMAVQESLIWTGHYFGLIDGQVGGLTRKAIADWQAEAGAPATGSLTPPQARQLVAQAAAVRAEIGFALTTEPGTGITVGLPAGVMSPFPQVLDPYGVGFTAQDGEASLSLSRFPCAGDACWQSVYSALRGTVAELAYSFQDESRISVNGRFGARYRVYFAYRQQGTAALVQFAMPADNRLWLAVAMANGSYLAPFGAGPRPLVALQPPAVE